jgi:hypothetical protein
MKFLPSLFGYDIVLVSQLKGEHLRDPAKLKPIIRCLIELLDPLMNTLEERQAFIRMSLFGHDALIRRIDLNGPNHVFLINFLYCLVQYDEHLLPSIIDEAIGQFGGRAVEELKRIHAEVISYLYDNPTPPSPGKRIVIVVIDQETDKNMTDDELRYYIQERLDNNGDMRFLDQTNLRIVEQPPPEHSFTVYICVVKQNHILQSEFHVSARSTQNVYKRLHEIVGSLRDAALESQITILNPHQGRALLDDLDFLADDPLCRSSDSRRLWVISTKPELIQNQSTYHQLKYLNSLYAATRH